MLFPLCIYILMHYYIWHLRSSNGGDLFILMRAQCVCMCEHVHMRQLVVALMCCPLPVWGRSASNVRNYWGWTIRGLSLLENSKVHVTVCWLLLLQSMHSPQVVQIHIFTIVWANCTCAYYGCTSPTQQRWWVIMEFGQQPWGQVPSLLYKSATTSETYWSTELIHLNVYTIGSMLFARLG